MYGSIMRAKMKKGGLEALQRLFEQRKQDMQQSPGFHSVEFAQEDKDSDRILSIIHFKDKDSYVKNANRPETDKNYQEMARYFEGPPEWIDIEYKRYFGKPVTESIASSAVPTP